MSLPQLTDEEWAAHDAKVAAEREAQFRTHPRDPAEIARERREFFGNEGWPARAIDIALADGGASSVAIEKMREWDHKEHNVIVLSGSAGTGKTVAAAWWRTKNTSMRFVRAATFAASSRYSQDDRADTYGARALCLDDLGAEYLDVKGSFLVDLDELIDTFYGDRKPLIITTNLDDKGFKARYGTRVEDRIRECGKWVRIPGASMRKAT